MSHSGSNLASISIERLGADLDALAQFGCCGKGRGIDRPYYSHACKDAVDWLCNRMRDAGLTVRMDAAGNVIGRVGPEAGPAVLCGSHIDTVPGGGKFDGALGVLAGLEAARSLQPFDETFGQALEIVAFADEEGAFLSVLGSRAMIGDLSPDELASCTSRDGTSLAEAMARFGLDYQRIGDAARPLGDFSAFVELHIEQGPILECRDIEIGIVESIVGLLTSEFLFTGQANHAGTTPVGLRRDALRAAAETISATYNDLERDFSPEVRLTFGAMDIQPGATNVVPGEVRLAQEVRASDDKTLDAIHEMVVAVAEQVGKSRNVRVEPRFISRDAPAVMSQGIASRIEHICHSNGFSSLRMPSGAGHDAQVMTRVCDSSMIFVPSTEGISHNSAEHTSLGHVERGATVLLQTLQSLLSDRCSSWQEH